VSHSLSVKDQTLDVAFTLKDLLKTSGATVYMARDGDRGNPNRLHLKD
jgi:N-acetylmuramoyl-L-alanine amidase